MLPTQDMATINALAKLHFENIPADINTIKDLDEYYKQFKKEYRDKLKEEKAAKAAKADKPKRKKGVDKDGNVKEKRPPSKYNVFVKDMYSQIKENNPGMDKTQIFAEIAKLWQEQKNKGDENKKAEEKAEESEKDEDVVEAPKKKSARKAIKKKEVKESDENNE